MSGVDLREPDLAIHLAEQRHRTKNVFQLIDAVLTRALLRAEGGAADTLLSVRAQLAAFATLDAQLEEGALRTFSESACCSRYLSALAVQLAESCLTPREIELETHWPERLAAPARHCRQLGLVMTELVINAAKHAFPFGGGRVRVALRQFEQAVTLEVADDGKGFTWTGAGGAERGLDFVSKLVAAIGGELSCQTSPQGTCYKVTFCT